MCSGQQASKYQHFWSANAKGNNQSKKEIRTVAEVSVN